MVAESNSSSIVLCRASCHINIAYNNVECSTTQAYNGMHIRKIGLVCYLPPPTLRPYPLVRK